MKRLIIRKKGLPSTVRRLVMSANLDDIRIGIELARPHYTEIGYYDFIFRIYQYNDNIAPTGYSWGNSTSNWEIIELP